MGQWIVDLLTTQQGGSAEYQRSLHRFTNAGQAEAAAELLPHSTAAN